MDYREDSKAKTLLGQPGGSSARLEVHASLARGSSTRLNGSGLALWHVARLTDNGDAVGELLDILSRRAAAISSALKCLKQLTRDRRNGTDLTRQKRICGYRPS